MTTLALDLFPAAAPKPAAPRTVLSFSGGLSAAELGELGALLHEDRRRDLVLAIPARRLLSRKEYKFSFLQMHARWCGGWERIIKDFARGVEHRGSLPRMFSATKATQNKRLQDQLNPRQKRMYDLLARLEASICIQGGTV